jgi:hypothetical protein
MTGILNIRQRHSDCFWAIPQASSPTSSLCSKLAERRHIQQFTGTHFQAFKQLDVHEMGLCLFWVVSLAVEQTQVSEGLINPSMCKFLYPLDLQLPSRASLISVHRSTRKFLVLPAHASANLSRYSSKFRTMKPFPRRSSNELLAISSWSRLRNGMAMELGSCTTEIFFGKLHQNH